MASLFGSGGGQATSGTVNPAQIDIAAAEIDMLTDMYNRLISSCHNKCISTRYTEPELNKGESVCVDRCVAKFFEVTKKVGERIQVAGAQSMGGGPGTVPPSSLGGF